MCVFFWVFLQEQVFPSAIVRRACSGTSDLLTEPVQQPSVGLVLRVMTEVRIGVFLKWLTFYMSHDGDVSRSLLNCTAFA